MAREGDSDVKLPRHVSEKSDCYWMRLNKGLAEPGDEFDLDHWAFLPYLSLEPVAPGFADELREFEPPFGTQVFNV